jgi:Ribonuclease G/E
MTRALLIACGAAETTGAVVDGGEIVHFVFAPARGDESLPRAAEAGDIVLGRIKTVAPALGGAFVDIGAGADAFLPAARGSAPPIEGELEIFGVRRPALAGKGAVLDRDWRRDFSSLRAAVLKAEGAPRLLSPSFDAAVLVARRAKDWVSAAVVIDRPEGLRALAAGGVDARCDERAVHEKEFDEALSAALEPIVPLGGGARLTIEETAGGAVVDVDSGGAANAARAPNDAVNERAARVLFRELSRRRIGGRAIVDFLPPSSPAARRRLLDLLETLDAGTYERRPGKLAPDGLFDMTVPRRDLSLMERASEPAGGDFLRPGRRMTLDWAAKRAIAALEARLRRNPRARLSLDAGSELVGYLEERPQWFARLADRYGARMTMAAAGASRSFDVRER